MSSPGPTFKYCTSSLWAERDRFAWRPSKANRTFEVLAELNTCGGDGRQSVDMCPPDVVSLVIGARRSPLNQGKRVRDELASFICIRRRRGGSAPVFLSVVISNVTVSSGHRVHW